MMDIHEGGDVGHGKRTAEEVLGPKLCGKLRVVFQNCIFGLACGAFLLFAFFLGFAIMLGAELNNAIQEEFPAPETHADQLRTWLESRNNGKSGETDLRDSAHPAVGPDRVSPS